MSRTKAISAELQEVHWKSLKTNPYQQTLAAQMLNKDGFLVKKKVKLKGSTQYDEPEEVLVRYDSEFFEAKVIKTFEGLLEESMTANQIQEIVGHILVKYLYSSTSISEVQDGK